jgi:hypothetical protein
MKNKEGLGTTTDENSDFLYHASSTPGLKVFLPRPYWFNPGLNLSGPLAEHAKPPDGCHVRYCVFAGDAKVVSYFSAPARAKRFSILRTSADFAAAMAHLGLGGEAPGEIMVFEKSEEEKLRSHVFYVYTFRKGDFRRYPAGEYVAEGPLVPLSEGVKSNPLDELRSHGVVVAFVADIEACFKRFRQLSIHFGIIANIEGSVELLRQTKGH